MIPRNADNCLEKSKPCFRILSDRRSRYSHVYASVESEQISGASNKAVSNLDLAEGRTRRRETSYYWREASGDGSGKVAEEDSVLRRMT